MRIGVTFPTTEKTLGRSRPGSLQAQPPPGGSRFGDYLHQVCNGLSGPEHTLGNVVSADPFRKGGTVLEVEVRPDSHGFVGTICQRDDRHALAHKTLSVAEETHAQLNRR